MTDTYEPTSAFLKALAANNAELSGSEFADTNLRLLLKMTRDDDPSNRDWATFLLAQSDVDSADIRDALTRAATNEDEMVRAEAMCGLARRDPLSALPFVLKELQSMDVVAPIFEAAAQCAHPSLVEFLIEFARPSDNAYIDDLVAKALAACTNGVPPG